MPASQLTRQRRYQYQHHHRRRTALSRVNCTPYQTRRRPAERPISKTYIVVIVNGRSELPERQEHLLAYRLVWPGWNEINTGVVLPAKGRSPPSGLNVMLNPAYEVYKGFHQWCEQEQILKTKTVFTGLRPVLS